MMLSKLVLWKLERQHSDSQSIYNCRYPGSPRGGLFSCTTLDCAPLLGHFVILNGVARQFTPWAFSAVGSPSDTRLASGLPAPPPQAPSAPPQAIFCWPYPECEGNNGLGPQVPGEKPVLTSDELICCSDLVHLSPSVKLYFHSSPHCPHISSIHTIVRMQALMDAFSSARWPS